MCVGRLPIHIVSRDRRGRSACAVLRGLRQLEYLNLTSCPITDQWAAVPSRFHETKWLELDDTHLTDAAVPHLRYCMYVVNDSGRPASLGTVTAPTGYSLVLPLAH